MGDYQIKENSIVNAIGTSSGSSSVPMFASAGGGVRITHREFLGTVASPGGAFSITPFALNPANAATFPWLSEIAYSFETFRLRGCVVEFIPTSGDAVASTNAALGSVILATQYNVSAPPFSSQIQMENYQYATSCKPSLAMIHPVECDPSMLVSERLYVYNGSAGGDPRWASAGTVYLATVGQQSAATLGELWISYDFELFMPKLLSAVPTSGLGIRYQVYYGGSTIGSDWNGGFQFNRMLAPNPVPSLVSSAGDLILTCNPSSNSSAFILPPGLAGRFELTYLINGSGLTAPTLTGAPPVVTNGKYDNIFANNYNGAIVGQAASFVATTAAPSNGFTVCCVFAFIANPTPAQSTVVDFAPVISGGVSGASGSSVLIADLHLKAIPY